MTGGHGHGLGRQKLADSAVTKIAVNPTHVPPPVTLFLLREETIDEMSI